mmetsp:Transcript_14721/g.16985  ORF Transcript_14721/g.16985 Transcript_14721/m.16985 type:complete len:266 (-) Transcript_14721:303-1100(-)
MSSSGDVDDTSKMSPQVSSPLRSIPHELLLQVAGLLDEGSLLRLSETDKFMHTEVITADLFLTEICVHCGSTFATIENRYANACIPISNKLHRRHRGERAASQSELRRMRDLVEQRHRIARGERFHLDDVAKETCVLCQQRYLGYQVSDNAWRTSVAEHLQDSCLCMSCYLNGNTELLRYNSWKVAIICCILLILTYVIAMNRLIAVDSAIRGEIRKVGEFDAVLDLITLFNPMKCFSNIETCLERFSKWFSNTSSNCDNYDREY